MKIRKVKKGQFDLSVVIYQQDGLWTAHCLEFDLVAQAETLDGSLRTLADKVISYIKFAVEEDWEANLFNPAPPEYWHMLRQATHHSHMRPKTISSRFRSIPVRSIAVNRVAVNA